jgi:mRNA interferase RelE/StbE
VYRITYTTQAAKALLRIANDPFASIPNAKKLQGRSGYRLRVGDWRVIYEINKDQIVIIVMKIAPRGEVY